MANENDSAVLGTMLHLEGAALLLYFASQHHRIVDDAAYWCALGVVWVKCGDMGNRNTWLALFQSRRRGKWKIMKTADRRVWRALPARVKAFRACSPDKDSGSAFSWSMDRKVCERLWPDRQIVERVFPRERIFAVFMRRGESELLVLPD
jgi:hypothetical protein